LANGPIYTIPAGLDYATFPEPVPFRQRATDLLIFRKLAAPADKPPIAIRSSAARVQEIGGNHCRELSSWMRWRMRRSWSFYQWSRKVFSFLLWKRWRWDR
jgi:hypothetical protein